MTGAFGLMEGADPFPVERMIEAGAGICSTDLQQEGLLFDGAVGTVLIGTVPYPIRTEGAQVFLGETRLRTRPSPALNFRYWVCGACDRSCRRLYCIDGLWRCRTCGKLEHASRHVSRSLVGYHRARWIRRRLLLPLQLFSEIPSYPKRYTRKRRLVAELRVIEASLAKHLQGINDTLNRRRAQRRRWPT